jgi:hypothetical protein
MTTKWTVKPFCTPHEDSDPLGVFEIKEVKAEAEKWEDASMDAAPGSDEEQHAIDRKGDVTEQAVRLIAAAPDMLLALQHIDSNAAESVEWIRRVARAAIAKATNEPVMAASSTKTQ